MQRLAVTATFILSLVSLSGCNGGGGSPAPGRPAPTASAAGPSLNFSEPPVVQSSGGVASVTLSALLAEGLTPSYAWDSGTGLVAPTIEVNPGDQIQLKLFNNLPPAADKLAMGLPDETNIHFHGLTSSPIAPGDDSIDAVEPGFSTTYDVTVNPDQPPGAYWYHAHPHGEAAYQVGYGMSGAIIIDGIENEVPDVAGLRQRLLIVRQHFTTGVTDRRRALAARYCGLNRLPPAQRAAFLNNLASEPRPAAGSAPVPLTVNNIDSSTVAIGIKPGERELFRVVNASVGRYLDLAVDGETLELVSQDGVPLRDFSGSAASETVPDIVVPPSGRAEFVVTGQGAPTTLRTLPFDSGPVGDPDPGDVIGMLVNDNGTSSNWRVPAAKNIVRRCIRRRIATRYRRLRLRTRSSSKRTVLRLFTTSTASRTTQAHRRRSPLTSERSSYGRSKTKRTKSTTFTFTRCTSSLRALTEWPCLRRNNTGATPSTYRRRFTTPTGRLHRA